MYEEFTRGRTRVSRTRGSSSARASRALGEGRPPGRPSPTISGRDGKRTRRVASPVRPAPRAARRRATRFARRRTDAGDVACRSRRQDVLGRPHVHAGGDGDAPPAPARRRVHRGVRGRAGRVPPGLVRRHGGRRRPRHVPDPGSAGPVARARRGAHARVLPSRSRGPDAGDGGPLRLERARHPRLAECGLPRRGRARAGRRPPPPMAPDGVRPSPRSRGQDRGGR